MPEFSTLLQQGNAWLFIPTAILLGALHGLEPGHSKTMMASFIIAIRGTVSQAVLLGISAATSHTAIVWAVALAGLYFGSRWNAEATEPYLQLISAVLIIATALWMMRRAWQQQQAANSAAEHEHADHAHDETKIIDTGHGLVRLEVFEEGVPPRFRFFSEKADHAWASSEAKIETVRADGSLQSFTFVQRDGFLESAQEIPEPHQFTARLRLSRSGQSHDYDVEYLEHAGHHGETHGLAIDSKEYQDAHELAHANDIKKRFTTQHVTTGQIVMFGLTGGLIPCPASITVLLLCLQLKRVTLGATLVLGFSVGLALTMVLSGTIAALSVKHVSKRFSGFGGWARKAPYFSSVLMILVGVYVGYEGLSHLIT